MAAVAPTSPPTRVPAVEAVADFSAHPRSDRAPATFTHVHRRSAQGSRRLSGADFDLDLVACPDGDAHGDPIALAGAADGHRAETIAAADRHDRPETVSAADVHSLHSAAVAYADDV